MEHESVSIHLLDYTAGATVRHTHYAQMVQLKSYIVVALCWPTWYLKEPALSKRVIVQELCESRGGRPGLSVLTSLLVSVDVKIYCTVLRHWSQLVPNMSHDI